MGRLASDYISSIRGPGRIVAWGPMQRYEERLGMQYTTCTLFSKSVVSVSVLDVTGRSRLDAAIIHLPRTIRISQGRFGPIVRCVASVNNPGELRGGCNGLFIERVWSRHRSARPTICNMPKRGDPKSGRLQCIDSHVYHPIQCHAVQFMVSQGVVTEQQCAR